MNLRQRKQRETRHALQSQQYPYDHYGLSEYQFFDQEVQHPLPILVTPRDFDRGSSMIRVTWRAVRFLVGRDGEFNGKKIDPTKSSPLKCEDIEGKVTRM